MDNTWKQRVVPGDMVFVVVGQWKRPGRRQVGDHHPGAPRLLQGSLTICWAMVPVPSPSRGGGLVNTGDWRGRRPAPVVVVGEVLPVGALHARTMIVKIMYDKRGVSFMTSAVYLV